MRTPTKSPQNLDYLSKYRAKVGESSRNLLHSAAARSASTPGFSARFQPRGLTDAIELLILRRTIQSDLLIKGEKKGVLRPVTVNYLPANLRAIVR